MLPSGPLGTAGSGNATSIDGITVTAPAPAQFDAIGYDGTKWINVGVEDLIPNGGVSSDMLAPGAALANIGLLGLANGYIANATIDLAAKVTGALPIANGGTALSAATVGAGSYTPTGVVQSNGTVFSIAPLTGSQVSTTMFALRVEVQGRAGAGACTMTGVRVGDTVIAAGFMHGAVVADSPLFESTITVNDQIQQGAATDHSAARYSITVLRRSV